MQSAGRLPLVLLADSQLLFWRDARGERFLARLRKLVGMPEPRVAYLGASNGDVPDFFELFAAALRDVSLHDCRHVSAQPHAHDLAFLARADVVMLAGGDPLLGLRAFRRHGVDRLVVERHASGALVMGLSAGAVQLGRAWRADGAGALEPMLALAPFVVDAHDEPDWTRLGSVLRDGDRGWRGLGVPTGAGLLVHADHSLEPIRQPAWLFDWDGEILAESLLAPPAPD